MTTQSEIRAMVRGAYDIQKLRIQTGNRIVRNFKAKLGQEGPDSEDVLDKEAKKILTDLRLAYNRITDGLVDFPKLVDFPFLKGDAIIDNYTELCLVSQYGALDKIETQHFSNLEDLLESIPIYTEFLRDVKGIKERIAGVIISEIRIDRAKYVSSLWKYAGLDLGPDGKGRSRRKEHLIKVIYTTKHGKEEERDSITYNPFLKTKLMGVLGPSFLRSNSPYKKFYDNYKHRLQSRPDFVKGDKKPDGHIHNASIRYMIKMFLVDLYEVWRDLEGLPRFTPYADAKLGLTHSA